MDGIRPHRVDDEEPFEFQWGKEIIDKDATGFRSYESFTYEGVHYSRFDCVYIWAADQLDQPEPEIGVILKLWETLASKKRVKLLWFFRPRDIRNFIGNEKILKKEIFLASGVGKGLCNIISPRAIAGKCNVVCTIKDKKNPQASSAELRMADYIFYRTFDVGTHMLSDQFPVTIAAEFKVKCFFNKEKYPRPVEKSNQNLIEIGKKRSPSPKFILHDKGGNDGGTNWNLNISEQPLKKRKLEIGSSLEIPSTLSPSDVTFVSQHTGLSDGVIEKECNNQVFGASKRLNPDTKRWFKKQPWEERMKDANEQGTLVFLENLDPSYTSSEVEDIVRHALHENVDARVLERNSFSSPFNGQAFVIFKSKVAAGIAIDKLKRKCLMIPNGRLIERATYNSRPIKLRDGTLLFYSQVMQDRPLIAYRRTPTEPDKAANLVGHFEVNKARIAKNRNFREVVATSHCSQANNMEYDLALKWCRLQEQTATCWTALHQRQLSEIRRLTRSLRQI